MRHLLAKSFTLGLYLIINPTQAQSIINTSSISHDLDSTLSIVIDAGGNISRGNSRVDDVNLNFGLGKSLGEDASVWLLGGHNELRGNGSLLQKTSFVHLRYNYEFNSRTTLSAYSQSQLNTVLDLESNLLALTPISPFKPRGWRGASINNNAKVSIKNLALININ